MRAERPVNRFEPIRRLAIVNRGEAAMRCVRAVKALRAEEGSSLEAVALYTAIDRDAPFVRHADLALELPAPRGEVAAYLDHDGLLAALRRAGADAVWPGWGFVSESPEFVEKPRRGRHPLPRPVAVGDARARRQDRREAHRRSRGRAGDAVERRRGGRRGDARCRSPSSSASRSWSRRRPAAAGAASAWSSAPEDLAAAFRSARAEAKAAFGDGRLFIERKVEGGRHIEVQIAADRDGVVLALGARDCSVQRRHQKVLEEAPPPGLPRRAASRSSMSAARRLAAHVGYEGVGTVEFLVARGGFHFLEMNPRLQVEHGITEAITGLDLVQIQIRIARGETLSFVKGEQRGHAIEARVCAEDPDAGFLPAPGRIARFDPALGPGLRVDTGVAAGSQVPAAFDSLIAKVIAIGRNREEARARLAAALADFDLVIEGGATNKGWLAEVIDHPDYRKGGVDTTWLDRFNARARARRRRSRCRRWSRPRSSRTSAPRAARASTSSPTPRSSRPRACRRRRGRRSTSASAASSTACTCSRSARGATACTSRAAPWRRRCARRARNMARLQLGDRMYRVLYDIGDVRLRVEVEGRAFAFALAGRGPGARRRARDGGGDPREARRHASRSASASACSKR